MNSNKKLPESGIMHNSVMLRKILDRNPKIGEMDKTHVLALLDASLREVFIAGIKQDGDNLIISAASPILTHYETNDSIWKHLDNMGNVIP